MRDYDFAFTTSCFSAVEVGLTDVGHTSDTLFIVAKGDFHFYLEDCVGDCDWLSEMDKKQAEPVARRCRVCRTAPNRL